VIEGLMGRKIGMTQVFDETGAVIPVTVIEVGPCVVTQIRVRERDGYEAVQLGFGEVKPKSLNKPQRGHLAGAGMLKRHLHRLVTVAFANPDLCDYTWSDFDYRYRYDCASLVEYLGHPDLATHQTFDHNRTSAAMR